MRKFRRKSCIAEDAEDAELYAINFCCAEDAQICAYKKTCCVGNLSYKACASSGIVHSPELSIQLDLRKLYRKGDSHKNWAANTQWFLLQQFKDLYLRYFTTGLEFIITLYLYYDKFTIYWLYHPKLCAQI